MEVLDKGICRSCSTSCAVFIAHKGSLSHRVSPLHLIHSLTPWDTGRDPSPHPIHDSCDLMICPRLIPFTSQPVLPYGWNVCLWGMKRPTHHTRGERSILICRCQIISRSRLQRYVFCGFPLRFLPIPWCHAAQSRAKC